MIVTIHQPNFFPYYPFFQKMMQADIFVILTQCQFEKNNFQNRFNRESKWYTMSVNKGLDPIHTKKYLSPEKDWKRIKNILPEYRNILEIFDDCISENMSDTNSKIIMKIRDLLQIETKIVFDYPTDLKSTERLVDICLKHGADTYISGVSGGRYMDLEKFKEANIRVDFQQDSEMLKIPIIEVLKNKLKK